MKYIRTKDNIFEVENEKPYSIIFCKPRHTQMLVAINDNKYEMRNIVIEREIGRSNWKTEIIKSADTIEELCDGFYLDNDENEFIMNFYHHWWGGDNFVCDKDSYYVFNRNDFKKLKESFYGYIKTNKGLIYVAKMNDKGELELL